MHNDRLHVDTAMIPIMSAQNDVVLLVHVNYSHRTDPDNYNDICCMSTLATAMIPIISAQNDVVLLAISVKHDIGPGRASS